MLPDLSSMSAGGVNIEKLIAKADKDGSLGQWLKRGAYGSTMVLGSQVSYAWARSRWNRRRVFSRLEKGYCSHNMQRCYNCRHDGEMLRRPNLLNAIKTLISPPDHLPSDAYYCILGTPGCGKTTLVRNACQEVTKGVIYMEVHIPDNFGEELAAAIDYEEDGVNIINILHSTFLKMSVRDTKESSMDKSVRALVRAATQYRAKHHRPAVLVLDDVAKLAEKAPRLLDELQDHAKSWANEGLIRVIFLLSNYQTIEQLKARSSWSRANVSGFVTMDEVTAGEAKSYLRARGVDATAAEEIMTVAGGRIGMLSQAATSIVDLGISPTAVKKCLLDASADKFKESGVMDEGPLREYGLRAVRAMVKAGRKGVPMTEWCQLVPNVEHQKALLRSKVFVRHYPKQVVTFVSRPVFLYAVELLKVLEEQEQQKMQQQASRKR